MSVTREPWKGAWLCFVHACEEETWRKRDAIVSWSVVMVGAHQENISACASFGRGGAFPRNLPAAANSSFSQRCAQSSRPHVAKRQFKRGSAGDGDHRGRPVVRVEGAGRLQTLHARIAGKVSR